MTAKQVDDCGAYSAVYMNNSKIWHSRLGHTGNNQLQQSAKTVDGMGFAGYVTLCVQLYCLTCHCLSLHVSAYMDISKCVGYFYFICLKESGSLVFCLFFFAKQIPSGI
jgi:hypothetical protein